LQLLPPATRRRACGIVPVLLARTGTDRAGDLLNLRSEIGGFGLMARVGGMQAVRAGEASGRRVFVRGDERFGVKSFRSRRSFISSPFWTP